jgi:hypothetical protein
VSTATNNKGLLRSLSCLGHRIEQRFLEAEARVYAKEGRAAPPCKANSSRRPSLALLMRCWLASQSSTPSSPTSNVAPKAATAPVMTTQGGVWPRLQPTSFLGQVRYGILPLGRRWQLVGLTVIVFGLSSVISAAQMPTFGLVVMPLAALTSIAWLRAWGRVHGYSFFDFAQCLILVVTGVLALLHLVSASMIVALAFAACYLYTAYYLSMYPISLTHAQAMRGQSTSQGASSSTSTAQVPLEAHSTSSLSQRPQEPGAGRGPLPRRGARLCEARRRRTP